MPSPQGPERGPSPVPRPRLIGVDEAIGLDVDEVARLFQAHVNPGQYSFMRILGLHETLIRRAEGMSYEDQNGRRILDFFGGFGSVGLGHNHPSVIAARRRFEEESRHEIGMAFMSQYAAALAYDLAQCSPGDLDMVFLGTTGSEAMEAALKVAERAAGPARSRIAYATGSFHGKSKGTLAVTDGALYRADFVVPANTVRVPFGDLAAIERAFVADPSIGSIVIETIQGGAGIITAPPEFWTGLRALCDRHGVLWIADEVQCGFGRTGRFYAFEHYGVVPDVTALAKSLGGGKAAVGAMIARTPVFMRAYGTPATALIHASATFGGTGEACITAIASIEVLYDEGLIDNAASTGAYLIARLEELGRRYPRLIKEVRGLGLMVGVEFHDLSHALPAAARPLLRRLDERLRGSLCALVGSLLFSEDAILVAFTEYNRNVIRLEPPLICSPADVDQLVDALDGLLSRGPTRLAMDYLRARSRRARARRASRG